MDLLTAVRSSPKLRDQLDKVWRRLGIRDETEQARILADQVRGTVAETQTLRSLFRQRRSWILVACCLIALAAIVAAALIPLGWGKWLNSGGLAAAGVVLATGVTLLTRAREGLTQLGKIAADLSARATASAEQRTAEEVRPALDGLRQAEADEKVAQAQLDEVVARVGQLASQLSDLMPGQRLYTFLTERAASGQYASQLGLISTIRKDFEHLVGLLRDWREEGTGEPARRPIDRIVLYIDDLDRCSPKQVVEVLQAVHLLLALDLFVVVVGVDPRWLVRSLRHQFPGNIDVSESEPTAGEWNVPPHDYLEKIFNIPFVLPGIPARGLGRVLRGFASAHGSGKKNGTAESDESGGAPHEPESAIPVEAHSELAASRDKTAEVPPRPLTEAELAFLSELGPCIGTPRAAKRLFNLYRMLRSTRDLTDASRFLGDDHTPGEYQAAALLLGLLTADPQLLGQVLDATPQAAPAVRGGLEHRPVSDKWQGFVTDIAPTQAGDDWANQIIGRITPEDVPAWQRLAACAAYVDELITLPDLSAFQMWAPRIRRFSFLLAVPDDDSRYA